MQQNAIQPLQRKTTHASNTGASQKIIQRESTQEFAPPTPFNET